jgi:protein YIPF6
LLLTALIGLASGSETINSLFGAIYTVIFGGSVIIAVNSYLVGCPGSIFMTASMIGYCLAPFIVAAIVNLLLKKVITFLGVFIICWVCYFWCLKSTLVFAEAMAKPKRKWMVMYPIMLYYLFFVFFISLS